MRVFLTGASSGIGEALARFYAGHGATLGLGMGVGPLMLDVAFVYETGQYLDPGLFQQSLSARRVLFSLIYRHLGS